MQGYLYAFGAAFFTAVSDAMAKRILQRHSAVVVAWARLAYASVFLLPLLFFIPIPKLDGIFWLTIAVLIPLEIIAILLYMKALQISPLSLTVPFLSLTPAFTILTSFLILGELPDLPGLLGICFIIVGAFSLNIHRLGEGALQPLRSIVMEKGSLFMIVVALIYSLTSVLGKVAIQHSSPAFMGICYIPLISISLLPLAVRKGMRGAALKSGGLLLFLIGFCQALTALFHFKGISMIMVSYMISVKRLSLFFGVAFGGIFFHEEHIRQRLFGSLLMLAGVVLIVI